MVQVLKSRFATRRADTTRSSMEALSAFREISRLEGLSTSSSDRELLRQLASGALSSREYVLRKCLKN